MGGGGRFGVSARGPVTGRGGDVIIIDDPLKADDIWNKELDNINKWYDENVYQRLNDKIKGVIILVMQRLHSNDLTAHLLEKQEWWEHLKLAAIAEEDEAYWTLDNKRLGRLKGEALHPEHEPLAQIILFKCDKSNHVYAAQYQQEPIAYEDAFIKEEWFRSYEDRERPTSFDFLIQSWDTASGQNTHSSYSVGITIGKLKGRYYILDVVRERKRFTDLLHWIGSKRGIFSPHLVIIEDANSGNSLIDTLLEQNIPVKGIKPEGSKEARLEGVSPIVESGLVYLPELASWRDNFLLEITRFPHGQYDDQVDAFSQALKYLRTRGGTQWLDEYADCAMQQENVYEKLSRQKDPRFSDPPWPFK